MNKPECRWDGKHKRLKHLRDVAASAAGKSTFFLSYFLYLFAFLQVLGVCFSHFLIRNNTLCVCVINEIKKKLSNDFKVKDLGQISKIIGIEGDRNQENNTLKLHQKGYIKKILKRFNMTNCKSIDTPEDSSKWLCKQGYEHHQNDTPLEMTVPMLKLWDHWFI